MSTFLVFFELRNAKGGYFKVVTMKIHLQFLIENVFIITVSVKFIQNCIKFLWEINLNSAKKIYSIVFIYDVLGDSSSNILWKLNGAKSNIKLKFRNRELPFEIANRTTEVMSFWEKLPQTFERCLAFCTT